MTIYKKSMTSLYWAFIVFLTDLKYQMIFGERNHCEREFLLKRMETLAKLRTE